MPKSDKHRLPEFTDEFYRHIGVDDDKLLANMDTGIELYLSQKDATGKIAEAAADSRERAIGIFSVSYVRITQELLRKYENNLSAEHKLAINFAMLDPRIVRHDLVIKSLISECMTSPSETSQYRIYFLTEWLDKIARGSIASTSDAAQTKAKTQSEEADERMKARMKKLESELDGFCLDEYNTYSDFKTLFESFSLDGELSAKFNILKRMKERIGKLETSIKEQVIRLTELETIKLKVGGPEGDDIQSDRRNIKYSRMKEEFDTLISVMRSCSVRGGLLKNTPALIDKWLAMDNRLRINTRAGLSELMDKYETVDHTIFKDKKGVRKAPDFLVVPGVGTGMAWGDRIMVSLFSPPTLTPEISIVRIMAGYRWYKTTSSYNWKDLPGEIGSMYQLIYPDKTFGNLEKSFIEDYTTWMLKESQGYQALKPDVRKLFWEKIPFTAEHRNALSKRATIYGKLFAEDQAKKR